MTTVRQMHGDSFYELPVLCEIFKSFGKHLLGEFHQLLLVIEMIFCIFLLCLNLCLFIAGGFDRADLIPV